MTKTAAEHKPALDSLWAEQGQPLWHEAWGGLAAWIHAQLLGDGSDIEQRDDDTDEVWQYMGTWLVERPVVAFPPRRDGAPSARLGPAVAPRWVHQFRHRNHPRRGARLNVEFPSPIAATLASEGEGP